MADRTLSHFACFRWGDAFFTASGAERRELLDGWLGELRRAAPRVEIYQLYPSRGDWDLLVWSALPAAEPEAPARFFEASTRATQPRRPAVVPGPTFWGLTRRSPYTGRPGSEREIDAVAGERAPYLVVYPFSKTSEWYLLPNGERREMMGDHIRVGRQFADVRQLLLYSFGLQDQEFVVVYETGDLARFSDLVYELRGTEARRFTALDTPILTALHRAGGAGDEPFAPWL